MAVPARRLYLSRRGCGVGRSQAAKEAAKEAEILALRHEVTRAAPSGRRSETGLGGPTQSGAH
jgi:hypothetical protein